MSGPQVFRSPGLQVPRSSGPQVFRSPGLQVPRSSGPQVFPRSQVPRVFRSPGLQVPRSSGPQVPWVQVPRSQVFRSPGVQAFRSPGLQVPRSSGPQVFRSPGLRSPGFQDSDATLDNFKNGLSSHHFPLPGGRHQRSLSMQHHRGPFRNSTSTTTTSTGSFHHHNNQRLYHSQYQRQRPLLHHHQSTKATGSSRTDEALKTNDGLTRFATSRESKDLPDLSVTKVTSDKDSWPVSCNFLHTSRHLLGFLASLRSFLHTPRHLPGFQGTKDTT
ncbi:hypothetical protein Hamer_G017725 [Homarus americanus]|uniref:Uncharacterized protein n=1 Tax=Homarus americanus TaxID=6706 RepID=A0A8J5MJN4_HOMAM|nr:hypothetical protein Hamer_G017725 [Homarus americanus]